MKKILVSFFALGCLASTAFTAPPNVVVFLADDAGWGDYSFSGNTQLQTPNIDSIAKEGISFDRFYVCPLCSMTRAEFLTGRYYARTGVRGVSTGQERINLDEKTIADAFRSAGYATGAFGKWHNGSQWPYHPMARGFDTYFGHTSGHWGEYFDPELEDEGRMVRTKGYIADLCTDRALAFIEKNRERPFFCYIPFTTPHSPWAAPAEDWTRFKDKAITLRATQPEQEDVDVTRCVLAMMENQDRNVGRVLDRLRDLKISDNTIMVYFSDNGPNSFRWTGGMKGRKGTVDEGGVRTVCYLKWTGGLPSGRSVAQIAADIDLLPTLTSLAGIKPVGNQLLDGVDLTPLLKGEDQDWPERYIFSAAINGGVSLRSQSYRLDPQGDLFDMTTDPGQTIPVNDREPELRTRLGDALATWQMDLFDLTDAKPFQITKKVQGANGGELAIKGPKGANGGKGAKTPPTLIRPKGAAAIQERGSIDPRPYPVGYRQFPITILPARDAQALGEVRRSSSAPNCSYFVNWKSKDDSITWTVDVATTGRYEAIIDYTCPLADAGAVVELSFGDSRLSGEVKPGWDPPLFTNQDTLPRPDGESQMKEFHSLHLGEIDLKKGEGALMIRALKIPGERVMDLRRLTLTLIEE